MAEEKRKLQQNRRQELLNNAEILNLANEEMSAKYNYFKVHRWEILKAIKEK